MAGEVVAHLRLQLPQEVAMHLQLQGEAATPLQPWGQAAALKARALLLLPRVCAMVPGAGVHHCNRARRPGAQLRHRHPLGPRRQPCSAAGSLPCTVLSTWLTTRWLRIQLQGPW